MTTPATAREILVALESCHCPQPSEPTPCDGWLQRRWCDSLLDADRERILTEALDAAVRTHRCHDEGYFAGCGCYVAAVREELEQMEEEWVDCTEYNPYTCPGFEPHQHLARDIAARKRRWAMVHNHGREDRECRESLIGDCLREALDAAVRAERARWQREAISAIPTCSTDGDDYRMAKLAAQGWRALANRVYGELMNLRDQVLRYRVPDDSQYIDALNRIDALIRDHDAALRAPEAS